MDEVGDLLESVCCNLCGADDYDIVYASLAPKAQEQVALTEGLLLRARPRRASGSSGAGCAA